MAKRSNAREPAPSSTATTQSSTTARSPVPATTPAATSKLSSSAHSSSRSSAPQSAQDVALGIWQNYLDTTPQRIKLIDVFMAFLVAVGVLQFVYCVIAGNYPFNAFLSGFSATVGQFVLTASLRAQTNPENKVHFYSVSPERAFADYVFGSMILHFFCVNFIN
ncbi:MAG: oligosaccharyltransferase complex subunit epsilon [Claussenomyces sp. TS43310]|nr:MAG: oligosaccharyltransferase complex subunit epsilon [Claussenomyces sp. TS43310]